MNADTAADIAHLRRMKWLVLAACAGHNSVHTVLIRYTRSRPVKVMYPAALAVFYMEIMKLAMCLTFLRLEKDSWNGTLSCIRRTIIDQPGRTTKLAVLALAYTVQVNWFYIGATHLPAATFIFSFTCFSRCPIHCGAIWLPGRIMVTSQLKIFTTAVFAVLLLGRRLMPAQWIALVLLFVGVCLVQTPSTVTEPHPIVLPEEEQPVVQTNNQSALMGFAFVAAASTLSGFSGIYFEALVKNDELTRAGSPDSHRDGDRSIWLINAQLSVCAVPVSALVAIATESRAIVDTGWLSGFDWLVWLMVLWYAAGGLIVSATLKYADNILKNFATSIAIINSTLASMYVFDFVPSGAFALGAAVVVAAVVLYTAAGDQQRKVATRFDLPQVKGDRWV